MTGIYCIQVATSAINDEIVSAMVSWTRFGKEAFSTWRKTCDRSTAIKLTASIVARGYCTAKDIGLYEQVPVPMEYITRERVRMAQELLDVTGEEIDEIRRKKLKKEK